MSALGFTCNSCSVAFAGADLQRDHYRSDWHRYNLKRKVATLPPVTLDNFQQRVAAETAKNVEDSKDQASYCTLCRKHFSTTNSYSNHLKSKKHKDLDAKNSPKVAEEEVDEEEVDEEEVDTQQMSEDEKVKQKNKRNEEIRESMKTGSDAPQGNVAAGGDATKKPSTSTKSEKMAVEEEEDEDDEDWDGEALGEEECLFCSFVSTSINNNVHHMTKKHSFFIPDIEYLVDLEGLIVYLGQKVGEGRLCLWCNEKGRMFHTTRGVQQHMLDKGHCKMLHDGDAVFEYADFYDYRSSYPDHDEKEKKGEAAGGETSMEVAIVEEEDEVEVVELEEEDYQLVLPSGATIGHRSLQRYYRQKLGFRPANPAGNQHLNKLISQYRALGWTGTVGVEAQKRAKDVHFIQRVRNRQRLRLERNNNKNKQHHFRMQVQF